MLYTHPIFTAVTSEIVSKSPPSYTAIYIGALLTLATGLLLKIYSDTKAKKTKDDEQMTAMNQSLVLLLSKQPDTTADLQEQKVAIKALETKQSAYDVSLALLKQEIAMHVVVSDAERKSLRSDINAVRDGLIERRTSPRD